MIDEGTERKGFNPLGKYPFL